MRNSIKPEDLGKAIKQRLTLYHEDVLNRINSLGELSIKKIVKETKATAPKKTESFRRNITSGVKRGKRGHTYVWYVKDPDYRLTHLLVHGHATRNGGRTKANPFLQNALDKVLPEYEKGVEEALRNGK